MAENERVARTVVPLSSARGSTAPEQGSAATVSGTGSVASIKGHPLHPMLVPFVIGLYFAATLADLWFAASGDPFWGRGASLLLLGTIWAGLVAALPGIVDAMFLGRARRLSITWMHAAANGLFLVVTTLNYVMRQPDPTATHGGAALTLTIAGFALLGFSGWLGGEMSYRHGIGVSPAIGLSRDPEA